MKSEGGKKMKRMVKSVGEGRVKSNGEGRMKGRGRDSCA